jgi:hypothetical protein
MSANERFEVRKSFRGSVDLVAGLWDQPVTYLCDDLSPRGTFLRTQFPLGKGEIVVCSIRLPESKKELDLFGRVVRVDMPRRKEDRGQPGMGIEFLDIGPRERLAIRSSLRMIPPPVPLHLRDAA